MAGMIRVLEYCTLCYVYPTYFRYGYGIAKILLYLYRYLVLVLDIYVLYLVPGTEASCNVKNARTHHPHKQNKSKLVGMSKPASAVTDF